MVNTQIVLVGFVAPATGCGKNFGGNLECGVLGPYDFLDFLELVNCKGLITKCNSADLKLALIYVDFVDIKNIKVLKERYYDCSFVSN